MSDLKAQVKAQLKTVVRMRNKFSLKLKKCARNRILHFVKPKYLC